MWKDVEGFEKYFMVSSEGEIFSKRSNKILKQHKHQKGYMTLSTRVNGKNICFKIHRLVAIAFIENPENKPEVNHKDGNKNNNKVNNLEWATSKENMEHAFKHGLAKAKQGFDNKLSKLSHEDINFIKSNSIRLGGIYKSNELAEMFGVHRTNIDKVIRGFSYKNAT